MKMKVIWFFLGKKKISGSYLKQSNSDLVFSNPDYFLKMSEFVAGDVNKNNVIRKIMNYPFLKTNFALTSQGKCWKDDVVMFTANLSVTIKRLTIYKQKLVLAVILEGSSMPSNMAANTKHTTLLKNQSTIKYLP